MKEYLKITNEDNMELMARYPDNHFDLAIVDPPYGIDIGNQSQGKGGGVAKKIDYTVKDWDKFAPDKKYFNELKRVSKNQIIWGANHFIDKIPFGSPCWIVWDKINGTTDFADCELAYTSFKTAVRKISWKWSGMLQQDMKNKEQRIHPTQKPAALYQWLLTNYAEPNFKILDTHLGSGSIAIAVDSVNKIEKMNLTLTACELDTEYYQTATQRIEEQTTWNSLF